MSTTRIEYSIAEGPDLEVQVLLGEDRERAFRLAARFNRQQPGIATVMTRTVTTTEWTPANTGVVAPRQEGKTGGEGTRQGEHDRSDRGDDGQEGADDRRAPR